MFTINDGTVLNLDAFTGDAVMNGFVIAAGGSAGTSAAHVEIEAAGIYTGTHTAPERATMNAYLDALP